MHVDRDLVVEALVLLHRLERIGQALDVLLDRGMDARPPVSWLSRETTRVRVALEDQLAAAPPD